MQFARNLYGKAIDKSLWEIHSTAMEHPLDIKSVRLALGMTQHQFAREVGVDQTTVCGWERGKHNPSNTARKVIERLIEDRTAAA